MRKLILLVTVVLLGTAVLQCSKSSQPNQPDPPDPPPLVRAPADLTQNETSLLESANKFGLNLFREIAANTAATENIFISPLSVSYAFGICYNGAKGDTREAIGSTLQMAGISVDDMNQAFHDVTEILTWTDPLIELKIANSFWSRLGKAIQPDFIEMSRTYFDARVEEIDFQAPWAADTINAWVDRSTNGKITEMVSPPISPAVAAILMNAIYFKGNWMFPFDTANTRADTFYLTDGSETECQMMWLREDDHAVEINGRFWPDTNVTYFQDWNFQAVSLPYGRGDFRMTIFAPGGWIDSSWTVDSLIDRFTIENWEVWLSRLHPEQFEVKLPKFKFEYEVSLTQILQTLGMEIAFDSGRADFSNMFVDAVGWIDQVKQKAFVQVDEKGTEAAAVTQVIFADALPPFVQCDRPFLVVIHEDVSGAILFLGKIAEPVWED